MMIATDRPRSGADRPRGAAGGRQGRDPAAPPVPGGRPLNRWAILVASCCVLFTTGAIYSFSVLRDPLVDAKGFSLSAVVLAYSVNAGVGPLPMTVGGWLVDRGAARWLIGVGGVLFGLGWIVSGWSGDPVTLVIGYGVVAGIGQGLVYAGCLHNNMRLFPDRRGMAAGLSIGANGASSVLIAPLARALIDATDVDQTMLLLGAAFALVSGLAVVVVRAAPIGYRPPAWAPAGAVTSQRGDESTGLSWRQMVATRAFPVIFLIFVCGAFSGLMIAANASPIGVAMYGLSVSSAAVFVSLYAASKAAGGIAFGVVSDRLGAVRTIMVIFVVIAASLVTLVLARGSSLGFAVGLVGLGACFGGVMGVMPSVVSASFGTRYQGLNYGTIFAGYSVAALFAPRVAADIGTVTGDYTPAFLIAVAAAGVGITMAFVLRAITNRDAQPEFMHSSHA